VEIQQSTTHLEQQPGNWRLDLAVRQIFFGHHGQQCNARHIKSQQLLFTFSSQVEACNEVDKIHILDDHRYKQQQCKCKRASSHVMSL